MSSTNNSTIRLRKAIKEVAKTRKPFAEMIDFNIEKLNNLANGRTKVDEKIAQIIESKTGVNKLWLMHGIGNMFDKPVGALSKSMSEDEDETSRITVPYYPEIKAAAGKGYVNSDNSEVEIISLPKVLVDARVKIGQIDAIKVYGESMIPTIKPDDIIFISKNIQDIINGKIYVIRLDDEIYVKRIFKRKDAYIIKSDNPVEPQFTVQKDEILFIGQVIYNMTVHI